MYNKLLERQIRRNLRGMTDIPEEFQKIFSAISDSYNHYESDRTLLERSLDLSSQELTSANSTIRDAYELIEQKAKDITDSIAYAQRIQQAMLPTDEFIQKKLPNSFVLLKPKDVVSGDFYWVADQNGKVYFAACDCTGHGVPGAFMSMIGASLLNEVVNDKGISQPSQIFYEVRKGFINALKQHQNTDQKDGMDAVMCSWDKNGKLEVAAAYSPLYLIRKGELIEIKPDLQPVGYHQGDSEISTCWVSRYTHHEIELEKGDTVYLFTDGYKDQFGGSRGKKFKAVRLKKFLLSIQEYSMEEQKQMLDDRIERWKGEDEQIDDILAMGVRF